MATALLAAMVLGLGLVVAPGVAAADPGDVGVEGPSHDGTGTPTGTKRAESVLWFNDGHWWGTLWDTVSQDFHIFRFDSATQTWVDTGVRTEPRNDTHHDVLWDGTTLYVASHKFVNDGLPAQPNFPTVLRRYSYDPSADTYTEIGSSQINNQRTETLTIDKDTTGRLWATWQQDDTIWLNVTGTDGATWGTPFPHPDSATGVSPTNVSVDDAPALIAFGGRMGLMWSRQLGDDADGFYWSVHVDGASEISWSSPRAIVAGPRTGDDHMNLKWLDSSGGRVYAAVKTSFTSSSEPQLQLLALSGGSWTAHTIATVSECPNRIIVLIDEASQRLRTFATYPKPGGTLNAGTCTSSGGAIYEKSTPLNAINFSGEKTLRIVDADSYVHNVTSTKQNLNVVRTGGLSTANSGVLILADANATKRYWHYHEAAGDTTAPTVTAVSPVEGATGSPVGTAVTATFSEDMAPATINGTTVTLAGGTSTPVPATVGYDPATRTATLDPTADLTPGTTYTARVSNAVTDTAGNPLATEKVWTFTTAAPPPTAETVTLTPTADSWVNGASPGTNYGTSTTLNVDASPASLGYLKFDLTPYAGRTITGATLKLRVTTSGSTGRQNIKLVAEDGWTETALTYTNRPAMGAALGILGPTGRGTDHAVTLDAAALQSQLGQPLSLGLDSTSSDGVDLGSRETTTRPTLVLTFAP